MKHIDAASLLLNVLTTTTMANATAIVDTLKAMEELLEDTNGWKPIVVYFQHGASHCVELALVNEDDIKVKGVTAEVYGGNLINTVVALG